MWRVQHVALKTPTRTNATSATSADPFAPDPACAGKASDEAFVRQQEAIPRTRWSLTPSIYRMTTIYPDSLWP